MQGFRTGFRKLGVVAPRLLCPGAEHAAVEHRRTNRCRLVSLQVYLKSPALRGLGTLDKFQDPKPNPRDSLPALLFQSFGYLGLRV